MSDLVWQPSEERIRQSNMMAFMSFAKDLHGFAGSDYQSLYRWSIDNAPEFWETVWEFGQVKASEKYQHVVDSLQKMPGAQWFEGAKLNFAENLLRACSYDDVKDKAALIFHGENGTRNSVTFQDLYDQVSQLAQAFKAQRIQPGDRIAAFMPNTIETIIGMLAASSLGAIWSSCSPDFGINGVFDRFGQIKPKILIATDGYFYNGKTINTLSRVKDISEKIEGIESVIIVPFAGLASQENIAEIPGAKLWQSVLDSHSPSSIEFEQLPFDHPLYIMYSSGTTGVPKCIVHSAGGTLLQHLKEHLLHTDLKQQDTLFYFTTCGWMMWNWLVSGLAAGATLVLFDGSPFYPKPTVLWDIAEQEGISIFGTSAKYIAALEKEGVKPKESHNLTSLKAVLSTGSPLAHESFDYVYRDIKEDVCLSSISGGTDIISCFALGNPVLPVYRGQLQCRGLGMAVEIFDDKANPIYQEKGELVCTQAFPSCPISFWNDENGEKFHNAYFADYDNIWAHGDYGEITAQGGVIIHGRSDSVLNPGGVRIGTAEIYRQVEKVQGVLESIAIGQQWQDDVRVILFVRLADGVVLNEALEKEIKTTIRANTTPRHVPAKVIAVTDIPRTISGKIVEVAVRNVVHGDPVKNTDALANPEALELYRDLEQLES
ncbi:MAG: acetoacetate--CoA ligase [Pseudomonadales bacterium]|nr:acetoacetate--CoA ligase [Pseudomonadales bacterium]